MILSSLILLLLSNAFSSKTDKALLYARAVIVVIVQASFLSWTNLSFLPLETGIGIYGGLFQVTNFTQAFNIFLLLVSGLILSLSAFYPRQLESDKISIINKILGGIPGIIRKKLIFNKSIVCNKDAQQFNILEYPLIILFILSGGIFLISTNDLITVFLTIELQSYGLYIISTIYKDSETATASGLTYFLLGGLSSCFILLGSALLYVNSGTTIMENIYVIISLSEITDTGYLYKPYYLYTSFIMLSVGFLFKVSSAPFHFWSPDVYDGIPTIVTTFVAIVAKISIFCFLLELVYYTSYDLQGFSWKTIIILSSFLSLIIGSVLGLTQFRIKRLFAYSTISHVGFILLALSVNTSESIQSYIFYIIQYTLSNLNAFMILIAIGYSYYWFSQNSVNHLVSTNNISDNTSGKNQESNKEKNNSPIQFVNQVRGYFYLNPYIAISFAITLFSFAGIPPLIGFFAKQMVLSAALDSGYVFMALIAILTSVIGAGYYLNLVKEIFFFQTKCERNPSMSKVKAYISSFPNKASLTQSGKNSTTHDLAFSSLAETKLEEYSVESIKLTSSISIIISTLTLLLTLFIYIPEEWFNIVYLLGLTIFRA